VGYRDVPADLTRRETADFGIRLGAWALDGVFSNILALIAGAIIAGALAIAVAAGQNAPRTITEEAEQEDEVATAAIVGFYIGWIPVWFGYDWISNATGAGWGKRIVGLRVANVATGASPGAGAGFLRSFISLFSGIFYLGYLWSLWDSEHRTWHDRASDTTVVRA
jgi:uncharacterized RDD family membrane protein YckC